MRKKYFTGLMISLVIGFWPARSLKYHSGTAQSFHFNKVVVLFRDYVKQVKKTYSQYWINTANITNTTHTILIITSGGTQPNVSLWHHQEFYWSWSDTEVTKLSCNSFSWMQFSNIRIVLKEAPWYLNILL